MSNRKDLTPDDLSRIYFRTQESEGYYFNQNARDATNKQFDAWARSRMHITGNDDPWSLPERAIFCNALSHHSRILGGNNRIMVIF